MPRLRFRRHAINPLPVVTLKEAIRRLRLSLGRDFNSHYLKGMAEGIGIVLVPVGASLTMSDAEFRRLEGHLRKLMSRHRGELATA